MEIKVLYSCKSTLTDVVFSVTLLIQLSSRQATNFVCDCYDIMSLPLSLTAKSPKLSVFDNMHQMSLSG